LFEESQYFCVYGLHPQYSLGVENHQSIIQFNRNKVKIIFIDMDIKINDDILTYDGFKCYVNCRKTKSKRTSGGIATFIKKDIVPGVKILDTAMDDMM
jgi:hypothetical protein